MRNRYPQVLRERLMGAVDAQKAYASAQMLQASASYLYRKPGMPFPVDVRVVKTKDAKR
jgi:hypothetical protein